MKKSKVIIVICISLVLFTIGCSTNIAQKQVGEITAPGTVDVTALVNNISSEENLNIVEFKITKINSYGPAASPIAANSNLKAIAISNDVKSSVAKLAAGATVNVVLKLNQAGLNVKDSFKWEIIQISNHNK